MGIARVAGRGNGRSEFIDAVHYARLLTLRIIVPVTVILMSQKHFQVMLAESPVIVEYLVEGIAERPRVGLAYASALCGCVAVIFVINQSPLVIIEVRSEIDGEPESVKQGILVDRAQGDVAPGRKRVAVVIGLGVESLRHRPVGKAVVVLGSILIHQVAVPVQDIVSVHVLLIYRINRSHELRRVPYVGH